MAWRFDSLFAGFSSVVVESTTMQGSYPRVRRRLSDSSAKIFDALGVTANLPEERRRRRGQRDTDDKSECSVHPWVAVAPKWPSPAFKSWAPASVLPDASLIGAARAGLRYPQYLRRRCTHQSLRIHRVNTNNRCVNRSTLQEHQAAKQHS